MTKTEFIESDIIEKFVLGVATPDEISLLNTFGKQDPHVKEEIRICEKILMSYAEAHAKTPPASAKLKLFETINSKKKTVIPETKIIQHTSTYNENRFKFFTAAASGLFLISLAVNFTLFNKLENVQSQLAELQNKQAVLASDFEYKKASFLKTEQTLQAILNTSTQKIILKGVAFSPASKAVVYWNLKDHSTRIVASNLPQPPEGKQYQLWALENGKPFDAGIFNVNDTIKIDLQQVKDVVAAQAFAVTLENKGGSAAPTLTAMFVMGTI